MLSALLSSAARFAFAATLVSACISVACVPATNPYDPETAPARQAAAQVRGVLAPEDAAPRDGLLVLLTQQGKESARATTSDDGSFVFRDIAPGDYVVDVDVVGFQSVLLPLTLAPGDIVDLGEVPLLLAGGDQLSTLSGTATLEGQADHSGILVEAVDRGFVTFTSASGAYALSVVAGTYTLRFSKAGFITTTSTEVSVGAGSVGGVDDVLLAANPARVSGHVDGEGADGSFGALEGATVSLDGTSITAVTNAAGDFTLTGVAPGSYTVRASAAGFVANRVAVFDVAGGADVALAEPLRLTRARGTLSGSIALADSTDASGVSVELTGFPDQVRTTGSTGAFRFTVVAGTYEIVARKSEYVTRVLGTFTVGVDAVVDAGTATLARAGGALAIAEAPATRTRDIHLVMTASNITGFHASEDPTFQDATRGDVTTSPYRPYTPGRPEPFTLGDADGVHTVFVAFFDGTSESAATSADVIVDREAPRVDAVVVGSGGAFIRAVGGIVTVAVDAVDAAPAVTPTAATSGLARIHIGSTADFVGEQVVPFQGVLSTVLSQPNVEGAKSVFVRVEDGAGNLSAAVERDVVVDNTAPAAPHIVLDGGGSNADLTRSPFVSAVLSATDANAGANNENLLVRVATNAGFAGAVYQPVVDGVTVLLPPGDGEKTVFAQFRDGAGNESLVVSDSITLDQTVPSAPTATLVELDTRQNGTTNRTDVNLLLSAGGVPSFAIVSESPALTNGVVVDLEGLPQPVTQAFTFAGSGLRTAWVRFFDAAGNGSELAAAVVDVDLEAPAALAPSVPVTVVGGVVTSTTLALTMPSAGQSDVSFAGARTAPVGFVSGAAGGVVNVTLTDSDGAKAITVVYRDAADNQTTVTTPITVVLDRAAPTLAPLVLSGTPSTTVTSTTAVTLQLSAADATSGVAEMRVSTLSNLADATFVPFTANSPFSLPAGDGTKTVFAQVRDRAGFTSAIAQGSIQLAATPPSATSVVINSGAATTTSTSATLTIAATGAVQMAVSQDNFASGTNLETFATTKALTLAGANPATKTVRVKFFNAAGLEGPTASDDILLDSVAPTAGTLTLEGTLGSGTPGGVSPISATRTATPAVTVIVTRPTADTTDMALAQAASASACAVSDFATPNFQPFSPRTTFLLSGADGSKRVCVIFRDAAGNFSAATAVGATITLDTAAPASPVFAAAAPAFSRALTRVAVVVPATDNLDTPTYQCRGGAFGVDFVDCGTSPVISVTLAANQPNTIAIRARDNAFNVSDAAVATIVHDDIPPLAPVLRRPEEGATSLGLQWSASVSSDVVGYTLNYGFSPGDTSGAGADEGDSPIDVGSNRSAVLSGLAPGTPYYLSVIAVDGAGNASLPSGELVAVPQKTSQRPLLALGGEVHQVAAKGTLAYFAQNQGILQVETSGAVPLIVGRAPMPGLIPDERARMVVLTCTSEGEPGHCLYVVSNAVESVFRFDDDNFRAGIGVVFFPLSGTSSDPARGRLLTTLSLPARMISFDDSRDLLVAATDDSVASFDVIDPAEPAFVLEDAAVEPLAEFRGVGVLNDQFLVMAQPVSDSSNPELFAYDLDSLSGATSTAGVSLGSPLDETGTSFRDPNLDNSSVTMDVVNGQVLLAYSSSTTMRVGRYTLGGTYPAQAQFVSVANCRRKAARSNVEVTAVSGNRYFVLCGRNTTTPTQIAAIDVAPTLSLVATETNPAAGSARIAAAAATEGTTPRVIAARGLDFSNGVFEQTVDRYNVAALSTKANAPLEGGGALALAYVDDFVVASYAGASLRVFDIKNPLLPVLTASFTAASSTKRYEGLLAQGNLIFANFVDTAAPTGGIDIFSLTYAGALNLELQNIGGVRYKDLALVGNRLLAARDTGASTGVLDRFQVNIAGTSPNVTVTTTNLGACATTTVLPFAITAFAARHNLAYVAGANGSFKVINHVTCADVSSTLTPAGTVFFSGVNTLSVSGTQVAVSDSARTHIVNVATPSAPFYDTTAMPLSGPTRAAGGALVGTGTSLPFGSPGAAPRFVVSGTASLDGELPFVSCGGGTTSVINDRGALASENGVIAAGCGRLGTVISTAFNPSGGRLLKDIAASTSQNRAPLDVDGNFAYVGAVLNGGSEATLWHVNEQSLAAGSNSAEPTLNQTTVAGSATPKAIRVVEGTAYVLGDNGNTFALSHNLQAFDASDPDTAWTAVGSALSVSTTTAPGGNIEGTGRFLHIPLQSQVVTVDVGNRSAAPIIAKTYAVSSSGVGIRDVVAYRDRLYFHDEGAAGGGVIRIFDIANPALSAALTSISMVTSGTPIGLGVGAGHLFSFVRTSTGTAVDVYRLAKAGDGTTGTNQFAFIGTMTSPLVLGRPTIAGDTMYVHANTGIMAFDLGPLLRGRGLPTIAGALQTTDPSYGGPVHLEVRGHYAFLLGDRYRVFDLR